MALVLCRYKRHRLPLKMLPGRQQQQAITIKGPEN